MFKKYSLTDTLIFTRCAVEPETSLGSFGGRNGPSEVSA